MALTVKWTLQAEKGLEKVIEYLEKEWTVNEILQLEKNLNQVIYQISVYPELYPKSEKNKLLRKVVVDKNNYLVYKYNKKNKTLEIINFRGTKQKPKY
ncbi:MAG: type II toxin-antitoxin system RelE/ParE family toxin [Flavobacterium sp.]|uniref:type II toxin-antitoxin system RelE/ParE family toxin n=1 Tax=Flavobacterium sp. TaxID=239 RepID=UPI003BA447EC